LQQRDSGLHRKQPMMALNNRSKRKNEIPRVSIAIYAAAETLPHLNAAGQTLQEACNAREQRPRCAAHEHAQRVRRVLAEVCAVRHAHAHVLQERTHGILRCRTVPLQQVPAVWS
jgi:hypothetical protein